MSRRDPFRRGRTRPLRSCGGCLLLVVALLLVTGAIRRVWTYIDEQRFPWAYARPGRPTLTGTWVGTLTTGGGVRRGMYLDLRLDPLTFGRRRKQVFRRARSSKLEGEARMCGGGREQRFRMTGNNEDDTASRFWVTLSVADSAPPDGLEPSHLSGRWNGRDSLALAADVQMRRGRAITASRSDPNTGRPASLGMRRAGEAEFRALCTRLGTP